MRPLVARMTLVLLLVFGARGLTDRREPGDPSLLPTRPTPHQQAATMQVAQGTRAMKSQEPTATSVEQLKKEFYSPDQDRSALALGKLIKLGKQATPILIEALHADNARTRRLAAEGLSDIGDPSSADALFQAVSDPEGKVRARAATALHKLGDQRAIPALIKTLDDYPDELHNPYTASMYPLMREGKQVLPLVAPLLEAPNQETRQRALLIIKAVAANLPEGKNWDQLWQSMGSYDPAAPAEQRKKAAQQWLAWVKQL